MYITYFVLLSLLTIYAGSEQTIPLSNHAAHFLLYYWPYNPDFRERSNIMPQIYHMMRDDKASTPAFVRRHTVYCTAEDSGHLTHLLTNMSLCLADRRILGAFAHWLMYVYTALMRYSTEVLARIELSPASELVPNMIIHCQR